MRHRPRREANTFRASVTPIEPPTLPATFIGRGRDRDEDERQAHPDIDVRAGRARDRGRRCARRILRDEARLAMEVKQ